MDYGIKRGLLLIIIGILFFTLKAEAQYSIENSTSREEHKIKSILPKPNLSSLVVINRAYEKNEAKKKRFIQNFIETNFSLTANQFAYKNHPGGKNSFDGRIYTYVRHYYRSEDSKFNIDTRWNAAFALGENNDKLWKKEDYFDINTALNYKLHKKWSYAFSTTIRSQFMNSLDNPKNKKIISSFFAPVNINVNLGITYFVDGNRNIQISPTAGNVVLLCDEDIRSRGGYGVKANRLGQGSFGASVTVNWKERVWTHKKNGGMYVDYRTYIYSFTNYHNMPNLDWQSWLDLGLIRRLSISLFCRVTFNDQIKKTPENKFWKINQTLGLTLRYERKNKEKPY